jgi:hypothetical protein
LLFLWIDEENKIVRIFILLSFISKSEKYPI